MIIWILGLSGSGKTTLAKMIMKKVKKRKVVHIDGDAIRNIYEKKLGHTIKDREINASRISKLVKYISDQNTNVIVSVLSNFPKWLSWNRKNLKNYYEVYLKYNLSILKKRKPKLYKKSIKNVVGKDIKFNEPKRPNLIIHNCENLSHLKDVATKIAKKIGN